MTQKVSLEDAVLGIVKSRLNDDVWEAYVPIIKINDNSYCVYLLDDVMSPDVYGKFLHLLHTSDSFTTINVYVNTPGGYLDTAEMIYSALKNSRAHTIAHVSGTVASAGTVITLGCREQRLNPTAIFMIHESSFSGLGGKASDLRRFQEFHKRWLPEFYNTVYNGLLTEKEMADALEGEELWFTGKEIAERIKNGITE